MSPENGGTQGEDDTGEQPRPLLRVVKGDPSPEELAALVTVVSAMSTGSRPSEPEQSPEWSAPHRRVRGSHRHGPGAWRASAR